MPRAGKRYHLVLYSRMLNRWWPVTLLLALALYLLTWAVSFLPDERAQPYMGTTISALGGVVLLFTLFLFFIRKAAYVQPFPTYLRLVTPFLRMNISYRRFRGSTTSEMRALFPPQSVSGLRKEIVAPLASMTAIVINLNSFPIPVILLRMFLSPFFFKDKTPHIVILVKDWLRFSSELDSMRLGGGKDAKQKSPGDSILSRLPNK